METVDDGSGTCSGSLQYSIGWVLEELDCHQEREGRKQLSFAAGGGDDCAVDCIHLERVVPQAVDNLQALPPPPLGEEPLLGKRPSCHCGFKYLITGGLEGHTLSV